MKYKYILGYLRLSDDDEDKIDKSNSIRNQRLLIEYFVRKNEEFNGAEMIFLQTMVLPEPVMIDLILNG